MIFQTYNPTKQTLVLEISSYAKKDIQASVDLIVRFHNAFQRWQYHRETLISSSFKPSCFDKCKESKSSKRSRLSLWRFSKELAQHHGRNGYPKSKVRHTVIRSAFVYKKTREQFGLQKQTYILGFSLTKCQQNLFVALASQLKLPAELVVRLQ